MTSDYGALHGTSGAVDGTDMEQPSDTYFGTSLRQDVIDGTIPRAALDTMVQRILTEMFRFNLISQPPAGSASATVTTPAHRAVSTRVAEEGTTLLKNDGGVLPLSAAGGGTIAVIGPSASASPTYAGGGSAYVIPSRTVSPLQGIQAAAGPGTTVSYRQGLPTDTGVVDSWYPGQTSGTALADILFGTTDPGGHLPVTFPAGLSQVPAATRAEFPGTGSRVQYREGIDVGYRWYDANGITPLFPFGFGLSYTSFAFSNLQVSPSTIDGVQNVRVSATITNVGKRAGSDVAQLYLGDPAAAGEPPRQLAGFQRVTLAPGQSAGLRFTITPRDTWWWDESAGGWSQTAGTYQVYVGDSSAPANLPLHGAFTMTSTPASRQVSIQAPATMRPGQPSTVRVTLSASGDETLRNVTLSLQLPEGWTVTPSQAVFSSLPASQAPTATFTVQPPSYAPDTNAVVHATADLGGTAQRQAGVTVTVR